MKIFCIKITFFVLLCIFTFQVTAKSKKRSIDAERPSDVDAQLYCVACRGLVDQMLQKVGESRSEMAIYDALTLICSRKNYHIYLYPPQDMERGCIAFMQWHEDDLIDVLKKRNSNAEAVDDLCLKKTKVCKGIDWNKEPKFKEEITIDGVKYPMKDGKVITDEL